MSIQVFDNGKKVCLLHREALAPQDGGILQLINEAKQFGISISDMLARINGKKEEN